MAAPNAAERGSPKKRRMSEVLKDASKQSQNKKQKPNGRQRAPSEDEPSDGTVKGAFSKPERAIVEDELAKYREEWSITEDQMKAYVSETPSKQRKNLSHEAGHRSAIIEAVSSRLPKRDRKSIRTYLLRELTTAKRGPWGKEELAQLRALSEERPGCWTWIGQQLYRLPGDCKDRMRDWENPVRTKGEWDEGQSQELIEAVAQALATLREDSSNEDLDHETLLTKINWRGISKTLRQERSGLQCRSKYRAIIGLKKFDKQATNRRKHKEKKARERSNGTEFKSAEMVDDDAERNEEDEQSEDDDDASEDEDDQSDEQSNMDTTIDAVSNEDTNHDKQDADIDSSTSAGLLDNERPTNGSLTADAETESESSSDDVTTSSEGSDTEAERDKAKSNPFVDMDAHADADESDNSSEDRSSSDSTGDSSSEESSDESSVESAKGTAKQVQTTSAKPMPPPSSRYPQPPPPLARPPPSHPQLPKGPGPRQKPQRALIKERKKPRHTPGF